MSEPKSAKADGLPNDARAFLSTAKIEVILTYGFLKEPIVFPCRLLMNDDEKAARQNFYALPEADQKIGLHAFQLAMLAGLVTSRPTGLPGFDEMIDPENQKGVSIDTIRAALLEYFAEPDGISFKIVEEAVGRYNTLTAPREFFR